MMVNFLIVLVCFAIVSHQQEIMASNLNDSDINAAMNSFFNLIDNSPVEKSVFSGCNRLVLVAGLEGTGHHGVSSMFKVCNDKGACVPEKDITRLIMHFDHEHKIVYGLFGAADVGKSGEQLRQLLEYMRAAKDRPANNLMFLGLCFVRYSAMLSYPNYNGKNKALDHPDLHVLAAMSEAAGLDFRVLVLQRDADEVLRSTQKRGIGGSLEPKVLIANAEALQAELALVDPRFFRCVQYRSLGVLSAEGRRQLADFLHPTLLQPQLMDEMLREIKYTPGSSSEGTRALSEDSKHVGNASQGRQKVSRQQQYRFQGDNKVSDSHTTRRLDEESSESITLVDTADAVDVSGKGTERDPQQQQGLTVREVTMRYHKALLQQRIHNIAKLCHKYPETEIR